MENFDIFWYNFLNSDRTHKRRPVLVLDKDILLPIAKITSKDKRTDKDYEIQDWKSAGLKADSVIRFDKIKFIKQSDLNSSDYIGHLAQSDMDAIKKAKLIEKFIIESFKVGDKVEVFTNSQDGEDWLKAEVKEITPEGKYILCNVGGVEGNSTPVELKDLRKPEIKEEVGDIRPTEEQKERGRDDDWGDFEVEHGYGKFQVGWRYAPLEVISRIDIMDVFDGDLEAVEQAKRDGFKFIDFRTCKEDFFDDFFDILPEQILDTEENQESLKYYMHGDACQIDSDDEDSGPWYESVLKEARDLSKIEGTISYFLDENSAELFSGVTGDTKKDSVTLAQNAIKLLQKAIDEKLISNSEIPHAKLNIIKISNDLKHNKLKGIMGLVTSLLTGRALEKPVDESHKSKQAKPSSDDKEWEIEECDSYSEEFEDIQVSNPKEVDFVARALRDMLMLKGQFGKSRYVKHEIDNIYEIRKPEGSGGQFRGYFIVEDKTFKFKLAKLKKKDKLDNRDIDIIKSR